MKHSRKKVYSQSDSNLRPLGQESNALTTELIKESTPWHSYQKLVIYIYTEAMHYLLMQIQLSLF